MESKLIQIGKSVLDTQTGEVTFEQNVTRLEPKVMKVLTLMVENQGDVLSQKIIFEQVWPNTVFSPNLVQRSIAQIRKAFVLDRTCTDMIVTFPKRGYCLSERTKVNTSYEPPSEEDDTNLTVVIKSALALLVLFAVATYFVVFEADEQPLSVNVAQLTATDAAEESPVFVNENEVAFIRRDFAKPNAIWLLDLTTSTESKVFESHTPISHFAWNKARETFIIAQVMDGNIEFYEFDPKGNDEARLLLRSSNIKAISALKASRDAVYVSALTSFGSQILSFQLDGGSFLSVVNTGEQFEPTAIALSASELSLAVLGINQDSRSELKVVDLRTGNNKQIAVYDVDNYAIEWTNDEQAIVLSQGQQMSLQSLNGELKPLTLNRQNVVHQFSVNPSKNQLVASEVKRNSVVWLNDGNGLELARQVSTSNALDYAGAIAPNGRQIAYVSERRGYPQVFLTENGQERVLFANKDYHRLLTRPVWSNNGLELAFSVNGDVIIVDSATRGLSPILTDLFVDEVIAWYRNDRGLLVTLINNGQPWLARIDLQTTEVELLTEKRTLFAQLTPSDRLIFVNQTQVLDEFYKVLLDQNYGRISNILINMDKFVFQVDLDTKKQVWRFDPITKHKIKLFETDESSFQLLDVDLKNGVILYNTEQRFDDLLQLDLTNYQN